MLDVLSKLETDGVFSPIDPAGLIEVAKEIHRSDLVNMVEKFMKTQRKENEKKAKANKGSKVENAFQVIDEETVIRIKLEYTLSQAAIFVQYVDNLQQAIEGKMPTATVADQQCRMVKKMNKLQEELEATLALRMFPTLSIVSHTVYSFSYCL